MVNRLMDANEVAERLNVPVSWVCESLRRGADVPFGELGGRMGAERREPPVMADPMQIPMVCFRRPQGAAVQ